MPAGRIGRAAAGSPQPAPGGGLQSRAARKQARPLGCGRVLSGIDRAGIGRPQSLVFYICDLGEVGGPQPPGGGGPQFVSESARLPQAAALLAILNLEFAPERAQRAGASPPRRPASRVLFCVRSSGSFASSDPNSGYRIIFISSFFAVPAGSPSSPQLAPESARPPRAAARKFFLFNCRLTRCLARRPRLFRAESPAVPKVENCSPRGLFFPPLFVIFVSPYRIRTQKHT